MSSNLFVTLFQSVQKIILSMIRATVFLYRSFEQAAFIAKDMGDFNETAKLIERCSNMYIENGTPDTASLALLRAAK